MCKFHKDVARDIATQPSTGLFDPLAYSIALVALARYWIDRYMPEMSDCDGYSNYAMAGAAGIAAFGRSGLNSDLAQIKYFRAANISSVRDALNKIISGQNLTLKTLNLPKNPVRNPAFLDDAMVALYEGDPAVALGLRDTADKPQHEPLRRAVEALFAADGVEPILQKLQEGSFAKLFIEAKEKANPALLKIYERLPKGLTDVFKTCAMCVGTGSGGAVVSHAGCVLVPVFAGASGSALSSQLMSAMLVTSPALAAGVTAGVDRLQEKGFSFWKVGASAALGLGIAAGVNAYTGHDHNHHHNTVTDAQAQAWLDRLNPHERRNFREMAQLKRRTELEEAQDYCGIETESRSHTPGLTPR